MKNRVSPVTMIVVIVVAVILVVLLGYRSLVAQPKLNYPPGFNPSGSARTMGHNGPSTR